MEDLGDQLLADKTDPGWSLVGRSDVGARLCTGRTPAWCALQLGVRTGFAHVNVIGGPVLASALAGSCTVHGALMRMRRRTKNKLHAQSSTVLSPNWRTNESMEYAAIKQEQMDFFLKSKAGCAFAAFAAKRPEHYGWRQYVIPPEKSAIAETLDEALADADVTMVSLIFPKVDTANRLLHLIDILPSCPNIVLEQDEVFDGMRCLGFRLQLGHALSWMSGFGSFEFLPKTRQTPFTEVAVRVKPRPDYDWVFEEHPDTTVHIGDLDMKGLSDDRLQKMWESSFLQVERLLGHKPDLKSAAKTTFAIPISLW